MHSLFKSVPQTAFSPHLQPILAKLKDACEAEIARRGLDPSVCDCFAAAVGHSYFLPAILNTALGDDVELLISAENLEFVAAYAMDTTDFDVFWMVMAEDFGDSSLFDLNEQVMERGLTSLVRRINFQDETLRSKAVACLADRISSYCGYPSSQVYTLADNQPWLAGQLILASQALGALAEASDCQIPKQWNKVEIKPNSLNRILCADRDPAIRDIETGVRGLVEPPSLLSPNGLERIIDLIVYNPMVTLQMKGWTVAQIAQRLRPGAMTLLSHYGYKEFDRRQLFRQMLVNGLDAYPRLATELAATGDELWGRSPLLVNNPRVSSLVRTLAGPQGTFADINCVMERSRLSEDYVGAAFFDLYDSHLSRTAAVRSMEFLTKPGDEMALQLLIEQRKLFTESVAYRWVDIERQSPAFTDDAYLALIEYHIKAVLEHSSLLGYSMHSGKKLLQQRPHLMPEVVEILSSLPAAGVSSNRVSQLAASMDVDAGLLLRQEAFLADQVMQADLLSHELGL
ncbi:hypothetical protein DV532_27175 (plasmid) [Pseudomonas sp. Leaf58]|nr:hypothetical protein DV532_27175 [Pseudomonas sp. Leaf58]KQN62473.1 hypothetical protein ASF02_10005 [Pseudomonas sp. Leaf58]